MSSVPVRFVWGMFVDSCTSEDPSGLPVSYSKSLFSAATSVKWVELHGIVHLYTTGLIYQDRCKNAGALIKSVAFCQIL